MQRNLKEKMNLSDLREERELWGRRAMRPSLKNGGSRTAPTSVDGGVKNTPPSVTSDTLNQIAQQHVQALRKLNEPFAFSHHLIRALDEWRGLYLVAEVFDQLPRARLVRLQMEL